MSAIYKEGYWYPADSLNTLKAVTMSNEDYEALTPQEKEELGGIEIFIPDRPLTGGGTGAVIIYNGVEYAGTPTSRLETLEEIVGDGQQSVGSDLTDAVTQLNSSIATLNTITSGNGTRNTSISSKGLLSYSIIANKFVLWRLSDLVISTATSTHGTNIFVGLPSGNGGTNLIHRRDSIRSIRVVIRDNAMKLHYDELTVSANEIYGSGWYILNS